MANQITPNPSVPTQIVADGLKFPKFINNLGIIPTSYKDSMSYYECLAWLCKYLEETVIPTVNQNGEAVEELQNLYIELNSYVTDYFDNLDVQQEINNKLDQMVASGALQNSLSIYFSDLEREYTTAITNLNNEYQETLGNIENSFNASQTVQDQNISALSSRIDEFTHLTSGSTTGDAELIDGRTGADGQVYANIGGAIRNQVEDLENFVNFDWSKNPFNKKYLNKYNIEFELGTLDSSGQEATSASTYRSDFISISDVNNIKVEIPTGYYVNVYIYTTENVFERSLGYVPTPYNIEWVPTKHYRITISKSDWTVPDLTTLKQNVLIYYSKLEDFLHDEMNIGTTNINNALDFGFKNQGLSSQPNDTALSNYLTNHPYEPLYFPAGRYIFAYPISVDKICFFLDNQAVLEYNQYGSSITSFVNIQNTESKRCFLKGGQIQCNGLSYTGVRVYNAHYFTIENLIINGATGVGVTTNPVAGDGNTAGKSCFFKNIRAVRTSTLDVDNVGFNDLGYDNTIEEFVGVDFTIGIIAGGGDKLINCHPWLSSASRYFGSIAFLIDHSTVELTGCVADTYERAVKTRVNNTVLTVSDLRVFINPDVISSGNTIVFQGTTVEGSYTYPIIHANNISINDWGGTTKLIDYTIPTEIYGQYAVSGVTQSASIINDSFTFEKRLQALES